jgi:hypothetical protein
MTQQTLIDLMQWIVKEIKPINHGEIHIVFKIRDYKVALIEKTKIVKEKPLDYHYHDV